MRLSTPSLFTLTLSCVTSVSAIPVSLLSSLSHAAVSKSYSTAADSNPVTLNLARRFNSTGSRKMLRFDQARAQALRQRGHEADNKSSGDGGGGGKLDADAVSQVVSYVVTALIGTPPQPYNLLVDTGSSNTWVGAGKTFTPSFTTNPTYDVFSVSYGSGNVAGIEVEETVTLAEGLTLTNQSIGVATVAVGFDGVDGILGIGPRILTCGTLQPDSSKCIPTVTDSAWEAGLLDEHMVGISFRPSKTLNNKNGELTFGGVDKSKYSGELNWTPLTSTAPAKYFVGIEQSITYGSKSILRPSAGILDTGTTLILIASDAFQKYQEYTGGVPDDDVGLLRITPEQYANMKSLYFHIGGVAYELTPNAQIWPRELNDALGGTSDYLYLIVNDFGSAQGLGMDFINGMSFLERFYMVYDIGGSRAALATTPYTYSDVN